MESRVEIEGPAGGAQSLIDGDPVSWHAKLRPGSTACVTADGGRSVTYAELDAAVARCARVLIELLGDARGRRVAVLGRNSLEQVMLLVACQRVGAIFLPINWRLTGPEIAHILADAEPALLMVDDEFAGCAAEALAIAPGARLIPARGPDGLADRIARAAPGAAAAVEPDAPCVLLYTSGTTGRPKGVVITRRGAFYACLNFAFVGEANAGSTLLCDVPMFHTVGLFAVTRTALTIGGTVVISDRFVPDQTLARLSDPALGVTHYFGVPEIARALLQAMERAPYDLSRLKGFFTGGAPLTGELIEAFLDRGVVLVNGYGMSEAGTVLHMPLDPEPTRAWPGCVGFPAPAVEVRIVDASGREAPAGAEGELQLRGPAVTPGYWNQPDATARAFVDGWFRTGDVARREPNGMYRLIDRLKDMYITGGENVYPAEVEAVLLTHPKVADAAVVGAPDHRWGECGVAFVVRRDGQTYAAAELTAHCETRLARYKLPAHIRFVDEIPRTASGKVRKDVLRSRLELPLDA
jgi:fatty-acyl-CoA synthase